MIDICIVHKYSINEVFIKKKPSNGWYSKVDKSTGEVEDKKYRLKETNKKDFWESILSSSEFKDEVYNRYAIASHSIISDEHIEEAFNQEEEEDE